MGGVAVLAGAGFTLLMCLSLENWITLRYFFISIMLMFIIGLRDDILALTPKQKLYSQFLPVLLLVFLDHATLNSTYGIIDLPFVPLGIIWFLSVLTIIALTNAYNLIDGLDGLAGTIGTIVLVVFGLWFYMTDNLPLSYVSFTFAGALVAFLIFNWQPSEIFMGDTGALMIGLLLSYLCIQFINKNYELPAHNPYKFAGSISTAICILIIPIFDTLRVIILRLRRMQSPFSADRNHVHHQFLNLGYSHSKSVMIIALIQFSMILLAWFLRKQNDLLILSFILIICLMINFILRHAQKRKQLETHGRKDSVD